MSRNTCRWSRARWVPVICILVSATIQAQESGRITPLPHDCELVAGEHVLPISAVYEEPFFAVAEGGYRIHVGERFVRFRKIGEVAPWRDVQTPGADMQLAGVQDGIAFFTWAGPVVERLDLEAQDWVAPMYLKEIADDGDLKSVLEVIVGADDVMVALCAAASDLRVVCLTPSTGEHRWSRELPASEEREYTGGYLLSSRRPRYARTSVQYLCRLGGWTSYVLVCTGERGLLAALDLRTGEERWRIERLWEFERAFIGPSVWSHHLSRFGVDHGFVSAENEGNADAIATRRAEHDERWECMLLGGPMSVHPPGASHRRGSGVLVAVGRAPRGNWSGYLVDCRVYEILDHGKPVSVTNLPRMVNGKQWARAGDGIVWACPSRAFVKMTSSETATDISGGPGGPDARGRVAWYRELERPRRAAWLSSDPAGDPVAIGPSHAFRPADGGYVWIAQDRVMHFPLWMVELEDGTAELLDLRVPFEGSLALPDTNYSRSGSETRAHGWYGIALTWLELESEILYVVLGREDWRRVVAFDLDPLFR